MVAKKREDSGVIDIAALQRRAQEERPSGAPASIRTPVPTVAPVREPDDLVVTSMDTRRRKKRLLVGAVAAGAALIGAVIGVLALTSNEPVAKFEEPKPAAVAAVAPPPTPAPAPAAEPPAPQPVAAVAPAPPPAPAKAKGRKSHHSSRGPKMEKVPSSG